MEHFHQQQKALNKNIKRLQVNIRDLDQKLME